MKRPPSTFAMVMWGGLAIVLGCIFGALSVLAFHLAAAHIEALRQPVPASLPALPIPLPADVASALDLLQQVLQAAGHYQKS